jgi:hypothetical protein
MLLYIDLRNLLMANAYCCQRKRWMGELTWGGLNLSIHHCEHPWLWGMSLIASTCRPVNHGYGAKPISARPLGI